jgi:ketosteroid isomerase-like protein
MADSDAIAIARRFNEEFAAAPFAELRAGLVASENVDEAREKLADFGMAQFVLDHVDPDVNLEIQFPGAEILTGNNGIEGWLRFWRDWLEPWEDLRTFPSNYTAEGDRVFVDMHVEAEGGISGAPVELDVCQVWTILDGRVFGYGIYPSRGDVPEADAA